MKYVRRREVCSSKAEVLTGWEVEEREVKKLRCHVSGSERRVKSKNSVPEFTRGSRTWSKTIHMPATL